MQTSLTFNAVMLQQNAGSFRGTGRRGVGELRAAVSDI